MNRKNGFWTFCFAFIPGGGQMYQGYMKRGLSLMGLFVFVIFLISFLGLGLLALALPVIWAYSFFDTFNIHGQTPEQAAVNPDRYLIDPASLVGENGRWLLNRRHKIIGWALVLMGVYALYANFVRPALWNLVYAFDLVWLQILLDSLSTLVVALLLVGLGVYLLRGGAAKPADDEDYTAFKGGDAQ